jgi:hypothetical protein
VAQLALAAYVVAFAAVVALSLVLSVFDAMTRTVLVASSAGVFALAGAVWFLAGRPQLPSRPRRTGARRAPLLALAVVVLLALSYVVALIVGTPPNGWDPLNYHLARAAFWLQDERVGYIEAAYDQRLNFNPPDGEIALAYVLGLTRHETLAGLVQFFGAGACAVGIFAVARRLGLSRAEAAFGALLFLTLPIVVLQASGAKNDLVVASFLTAASVFVLGNSRRDLGLAALATALAVGTKFTAAYGLALLLALAVVAPPRPWRAARIIALALGAALGAYWYVVNAVETGHLLGDQSNIAPLTAPFDLRENAVTAFGLIVDTLDLSGATGKDILLYLVAAIAVATGLMLAGARPQRGVLAGALVASPLALYIISSEVARQALVSFYDFVGASKGYLAVGDDVSSSPTTASDTASWFGPAGLLLVIGVGVTAIVLVRRRSLAPLASVLALAPLVWLVLAALTLTYHPWQGRFFVFPVALSAALWGLLLRKQALAWCAVALVAITVLLSLVHYVEKPSGLRLLDRARTVSVWEMSRWQVQSQHDPPIGSVFRFLDDDVPRDASIALALGSFGFPAFGPHLERRVPLVPLGSDARDIQAEWLFAFPERALKIDSRCWHAAFRSERGTVFRRAESCA